jgi:hypothetical protein
MRDLDAHDIVQVCTLLTPSRHVDGTDGVCRQPRVGDRGAVVFRLDATNFIVECVDPEGLTVWLADFHVDELKLIQVCR